MIPEQKIQELENEILRLRTIVDEASSVTKSTAEANVNAAQMYMELEEKTGEIERQKEEIQKAYNKLELLHKELGEKTALLKSQSEQIKWELDTASEVQRAIMCPPIDSFPELQVAARTSPASQINGDFYIVHKIDLNNIAVLIADGVGHGVPAALTTIMARSFLQDIAVKITSPAQILTELNQKLKDNLFEGGYLTAFLLIYNRSTNQIKYTSAGHTPVVIINGIDNSIKFLESDGPILGVITDYEYIDESVDVDLGDRIVLYTDGITEARSPGGEFYGQDRFLKSVTDLNLKENIQFIIDVVLDKINDFCNTLSQDDDRTIVLIEVCKKKNLDELRTLLDGYSENSPKEDYLRLFNGGVEKIKQKDYDYGILIFTNLNKIHEKNYKILFNLGYAYSKINEIVNARKCFIDSSNSIELYKIKNKDTITESELSEISEISGIILSRLKKLDEQREIRSKMKAEIVEIDITTPKEKFLDFCKKAIEMPIFAGLQYRIENGAAVLTVPGEPELTVPLEEKISIDDKFSRGDYPKQIFLFFEGLAAVFGCNFVVVYEREDKTKTKVSIVDGMYTSCGDRCMARAIVFPNIDK